MGSKLRFDWNSANLAHIARHGVSREEVEDVLSGSSITLLCVRVKGEDRTVSVGRTRAGRVLKIVHTLRRGKIRAITAHEDRQWRKRL